MNSIQNYIDQNSAIFDNAQNSVFGDIIPVNTRRDNYIGFQRGGHNLRRCFGQFIFFVPHIAKEQML